MIKYINFWFAKKIAKFPIDFFPTPESVFSGAEARYFVTLASVKLEYLLPQMTGNVHFLRPRMLDPNGDDTAIKENDDDYPVNWYPFKRDLDGRYISKFHLSGKPRNENNDIYKTPHRGNSYSQFIQKNINMNDLLECSDFSGEWPNANWNCGKSAEQILGRPLHYLGELDSTNFCMIDCGSVLLYDEEFDEIIQVFHWT